MIATRLTLIVWGALLTLALAVPAAAYFAASPATIAYRIATAEEFPVDDDEMWVVEWEGHGQEHVDHGCDEGEVAWQFVLTHRPAEAEIFLLDATFANNGDTATVADVEGDPRGDGRSGAVHFYFTIEIDAGFTLVAAAVRLDAEPTERTQLVLSDTECTEESETVEDDSADELFNMEGSEADAGAVEGDEDGLDPSDDADADTDSAENEEGNGQLDDDVTDLEGDGSGAHETDGDDGEADADEDESSQHEEEAAQPDGDGSGDGSDPEPDGEDEQ